MLFTLGLFLISCGWVTSQDSLERDPSNFEDLTAESTTEPTLFEPLPPLPDMTSVQRIPGPPGFAPPPEFRKTFNGRVGFVITNGTARIMGVSRRKPSAEEEETVENMERRTEENQLQKQ